ncbi:MAG: hypothetical protein ACD_17C00078G0002 [uncultured bacterium]|nr:MAG: hypothetical protein ACD_17C00078G0002 [uncultured bacterium]OGN56442.1 MAG: phosphoglycerate mutase [Chlamydiae bacterium RIFCSPHIGHO2_01_FULL_44_39]OGN57138.1 MAG: phosphoglycerate mutase [Chlamydiae bacterium RIFCSPHIGHO2_02_FULL_45_9]OGN60166.1 MAG: phosphoglycerate mutase [Chlamydiae bacterium RIFCSPHIGHO2_12_FULL_44_59]OGN67181.1 MAG: phosphoglycerate mutase [Chlamydiae bacterium RIFCSPLOWO2_01_FULL_44_52]OGN67771.1 MAG: phosphoglycerate mutase [Chlamydiae bacterium RIFCSPLOWO2_0
MKHLYLCRHGETAWTLSSQHTSTTDIELTERGAAQAKKLRTRMEKVPLDAVFTSPLRRARDTCQNPKARIDPNLVEWGYGDYEGLTTQEIQAKHPQWNLFQNGAPHGESVRDVRKRADAFLKRIRAYEGNVAVFSHGHFMRVLAARYLGLKVEKGQMFTLSVASLSILGSEHDHPAILLWNDTDHLV